MTVFSQIPTAEVESIRSDIDTLVELLSPVIATDIKWKLELVSARLNPECFPSVEQEWNFTQPEVEA